MYFKDIESNTAAKRQHDQNMKKACGERLRKNAEWNKKNKS